MSEDLIPTKSLIFLKLQASFNKVFGKICDGFIKWEPYGDFTNLDQKRIDIYIIKLKTINL